MMREVHAIRELLLALEENRPPVLEGYSAEEVGRANWKVNLAGFVERSEGVPTAEIVGMSDKGRDFLEAIRRKCAASLNYSPRFPLPRGRAPPLVVAKRNPAMPLCEQPSHNEPRYPSHYGPGKGPMGHTAHAGAFVAFARDVRTRARIDDDRGGSPADPGLLVRAAVRTESPARRGGSAGRGTSRQGERA